MSISNIDSSNSFILTIVKTLITLKKIEMNPKKIITVLLFAILATTVIPAFAGDPINSPNTEKTSNEARAQQVVNRIIEIRDMDKSNLTSAEKKELRKELKQLRREAKPRSNGVYLSIGAIVIIAVLLILLL